MSLLVTHNVVRGKKSIKSSTVNGKKEKSLTGPGDPSAPPARGSERSRGTAGAEPKWPERGLNFCGLVLQLAKGALERRSDWVAWWGLRG